MKTLYKSLLYTALNAVFVSGLLVPAHAQSDKRGGGSSSSSASSSPRPSGGASSGGGVRASSGGSFGGGARPAGFSRPAGGMMGPRVSGVQNNMNMNRPGGSMGGIRPSYGFSPRQGGISSGQPGGLRANFVSPQRQGGNITQNFASRGIVNSYPQRVGASASQGVTSYRNPTHGRVDYWGSHNYYYHNHGYYKTAYQPRLGFTCTVLPYGYYPFFWGDAQYYYSDGLFYEYENDQYTVVEPPVGAEVASLPSDAQSIVINGQQYYESAGVYYQPYTKDDGTLVYVVAGKDGELNTNTSIQDNQPAPPQIGDIVNQLPANCRKIMVSGQKLYVSPDGIYYQPLVDANNITTYKIVGLPSDQIDQN